MLQRQDAIVPPKWAGKPVDPDHDEIYLPGAVLHGYTNDGARLRKFREKHVRNRGITISESTSTNPNTIVLIARPEACEVLHAGARTVYKGKKSQAEAVQTVNHILHKRGLMALHAKNRRLELRYDDPQHLRRFRLQTRLPHTIAIEPSLHDETFVVGMPILEHYEFTGSTTNGVRWGSNRVVSRPILAKHGTKVWYHTVDSRAMTNKRAKIRNAKERADEKWKRAERKLETRTNRIERANQRWFENPIVIRGGGGGKRDGRLQGRVNNEARNHKKMYVAVKPTGDSKVTVKDTPRDKPIGKVRFQDESDREPRNKIMFGFGSLTQLSANATSLHKTRFLMSPKDKTECRKPYTAPTMKYNNKPIRNGCGVDCLHAIDQATSKRHCKLDNSDSALFVSYQRNRTTNDMLGIYGLLRCAKQARIPVVILTASRVFLNNPMDPVDPNFTYGVIVHDELHSGQDHWMIGGYATAAQIRDANVPWESMTDDHLKASHIFELQTFAEEDKATQQERAAINSRLRDEDDPILGDLEKRLKEVRAGTKPLIIQPSSRTAKDVLIEKQAQKLKDLKFEEWWNKVPAPRIGLNPTPPNGPDNNSKRPSGPGPDGDGSGDPNNKKLVAAVDGNGKPIKPIVRSDFSDLRNYDLLVAYAMRKNRIRRVFNVQQTAKVSAHCRPKPPPNDDDGGEFDDFGLRALFEPTRGGGPTRAQRAKRTLFQLFSCGGLGDNEKREPKPKPLSIRTPQGMSLLLQRAGHYSGYSTRWLFRSYDEYKQPCWTVFEVRAVNFYPLVQRYHVRIRFEIRETLPYYTTRVTHSRGVQRVRASCHGELVEERAEGHCRFSHIQSLAETFRISTSALTPRHLAFYPDFVQLRGGSVDLMPHMCNDVSLPGYLIVPNMLNASYGRDDPAPYACGNHENRNRTPGNGTRYSWYCQGSHQRVCIDPSEMIGWYCIATAGPFALWSRTHGPLRALAPWPFDMTGVICSWGWASTHTLYLAGTIIADVSTHMRSQPAIHNAYGVSLASMQRYITSLTKGLKWLGYHPTLSSEISGSLPCSLLAHLHDRTTSAEWNAQTIVFRLKAFLYSGDLWVLVSETGVVSALSFIWAMIARMLGLGFTATFVGTLTVTIMSESKTPTWVRWLMVLLSGPQSFLMSVCLNSGRGKLIWRLFIGALLTYVAVVLLPMMPIPTLIATIAAKWAALSKFVALLTPVVGVAAVCWNKRERIRRKLVNEPGVTLNPITSGYGVGPAQLLRGGSPDDGIARCRLKHELTDVERAQGHLDYGYRLRAFVNLNGNENRPTVWDHYACSNSALADSVSQRLTKPRANPIIIDEKGRMHPGAPTTRPHFRHLKRATDRAYRVLEKIAVKAQSALEADLTPFVQKYGFNRIETLLDDAFPYDPGFQARVNPLFVEWFAHIEPEKKRNYLNEVQRKVLANEREAPDPSEVKAEANIKIEIMPYMADAKQLKGRVIQFMKPKYMCYVAPLCWKYTAAIKKSLPDNLAMTSGMSVDEYNDFINTVLSKVNEDASYYCTLANGDDNLFLASIRSRFNPAFGQCVEQGYKTHARDIVCHYKTNLCDAAYCSSTFLPYEEDGRVKFRYYPLPFKALYKSFVSIASTRFKTKVVGADLRVVAAATRDSMADMWVSRFFAFRGDPFMEPIYEALLRHTGRAYLLRYDQNQTADWLRRHPMRDEQWKWKPGTRVYNRNDKNDEMAWEAHSFRTGLERSSLISLRDEIISAIRLGDILKRVDLANFDVFVDGLRQEQGLKVVSQHRVRPDWLPHGEVVAIEGDNGSYDASTTRYTHICMNALQRIVTGDSLMAHYNDRRLNCPVQARCLRGYGSWCIKGQMMSGFPDTTISNTLANFWEMLTAIALFDESALPTID